MKLRLLFASILVLAQLPFTALAAPAGGAAVAVEVSQLELDTVTGGACTSCHTPPPTPPQPEHPSRIGRPYWEHSRTQLISYTNPGGELVYQHINSSYISVDKTFTATTTQSFNWSVSGGIPAGIISASLGNSYTNTNTSTFNVVVPPRTNYKYYISHPVSRYHYTFTRYQDWSDGSRQSLSSGIVPGSRTSYRTHVMLSAL